MRAVRRVVIFVLVTGVGGCIASHIMARELVRRGHVSVAPIGGLYACAPWEWLLWSTRYARVLSAQTLHEARVAGFGSLGVAWVLFLAMSLGARKPRVSSAYGSARWADRDELADAGLLDARGVVLCQTREARFARTRRRQWKLLEHGELICHDGPEHVLCFAPTGSGKGVGLVIPTLLTWTHSAIIFDIKKELWSATAGFRSKFSHALRFEPTNPGSVRFNPLCEVRRGMHEVRDAQNIAEILVDPVGDSKPPDPHWREVGHSLLTAVLLHVLYAEPDKTLAGCGMFVSDPQRTHLETLERMLTTRHLPSGPHPVVASTAREMLNKADKELSGVFSTAAKCFSLFRDPLVANATSCSDFRIEDLRNLERPVSLYLVVPPSDIDRLTLLVRLMLSQIGRRLTESHDAVAGQHRLLLMLDEFPVLGRLAFFQTQLAYLRGYGIKAFMIAQSLNQLEDKYGANNSILDNAHVRLTFGALDERTARRISDLLGQATFMRTQMSRGKKQGSLFFDHVTESEQEYARPLRTPGEILQLPGDEALLFVGGLQPYRGKRIMHYLDRRFRPRANLPPPDSARAQARELPEAKRSDWDSLAQPPGGPLAPAAAPVPAVPSGAAAIVADAALSDEMFADEVAGEEAIERAADQEVPL